MQYNHDKIAEFRKSEREHRRAIYWFQRYLAKAFDPIEQQKALEQMQKDYYSTFRKIPLFRQLSEPLLRTVVLPKDKGEDFDGEEEDDQNEEDTLNLMRKRKRLAALLRFSTLSRLNSWSPSFQQDGPTIF